MMVLEIVNQQYHVVVLLLIEIQLNVMIEVSLDHLTKQVLWKMHVLQQLPVIGRVMQDMKRVEEVVYL